MSERKWLPTLAELLDRLSIVQLKEIFICEHAAEYRAEIAQIEHDIDMLLDAHKDKISAKHLRAIMLVMLANRVIWENESKARLGGDSQDKLLKFTHSINGVRNTAKNIVAEIEGGRLDYKIDCLATGLPPEYGNWDIFK